MIRACVTGRHADADAQATPLIEVRDAWKVYRLGSVEIPAVRGVSVTIPAGQFVAISGASGSGKSTFMHLVGCLGRMTRGTFRFEGHDVAALSGHQLAALRNRRIGFVFQNFNLLARTSLLDNVAMPLAYQGVSLRQRRGRSAAVLERLGLADRARHNPAQLSGGQQQRAAIARALITQPAVILADEPTGNLDSANSARIMEVFRELHRDDGMAIVVVSHEPEVTAYAERHIVFRDGEITTDVLQEITTGVA